LFNSRAIFNLNVFDIVYQASPLTFDPSLIEIFSSLYAQSTLLILPQIFKIMSKKLVSVLQNYKVSFMQAIKDFFAPFFLL
jgi:acyl-CoA synthetase